MIFVDTSALLALMDADDANHIRAKERWGGILNGDLTPVCSNYILVEAFALLQHRLGIDAVRAFQEDIIPVLAVEWVSEDLHQAAISGVLSASRKSLSLVDCASFAVMRNLGIKSAFAFDRHFREQGFECVP